MKFNIRIAALFFSALISSVCNAETGYEVELIIFEDTQSRYQGSEDWTFNDMLNNSNQEDEVVAVEPDAEFMELDWAKAKLSESLERIKSNSNYNILINKRWKQTGLDRDKAYSIELSSIPVEEVEQETDITDIAEATTQDDSVTETIVVPDSFSTDKLETINTDSFIQGQIKLIMSRYLHFEVNLNYYQWVEGMDSPGFTSYPVVAERRMRSREIHYLDHPMIGIIVLATPYKFEEVIEDTENTLDTPSVKISDN